MAAREIKAFEYLCDHCGEPLLEPEFESPFYMRADEDGKAPRLGDYGHDHDMFETVESLPRQTTEAGHVDILTPEDKYVHAWRKDNKACWHWCEHAEVQRIGPAEDCPVKDTHDE